MSQKDAYALLMEKLGYSNCQELRRVLEVLMTVEEAEIASLLPASPAEIARLINMNEQMIESVLTQLYQKGVIMQTPDKYVFPEVIISLIETTLWDPRAQPEWRRQLSEAWKEFSQVVWYQDYATQLSVACPPSFRVLPYWQAIANVPGVMPSEDVRLLLKRVRTIALVDCACRTMSGNCDRPIDVCLLMNDMAEDVIRRGCGRRLSYEEGMATIDRTEEAGLIHRIRNKQWVTTAICNCCTCDCFALVGLKSIGKLHECDAKSRYEAVVDNELCTGCQTCIDRCQYQAIEMMQSPPSKKLKAYVNPAKCYGCGACVVKCQEKALTLRIVRFPDHIPEEKPIAGPNLSNPIEGM